MCQVRKIITSCDLQHEPKASEVASRVKLPHSPAYAGTSRVTQLHSPSARAVNHTRENTP